MCRKDVLPRDTVDASDPPAAPNSGLASSLTFHLLHDFLDALDMVRQLQLVPQLRGLIGGVVNQQRAVSDVAGCNLKFNVFRWKLALLFHRLTPLQGGSNHQPM